MGMIGELSAPGMQDSGKSWQVSADEPGVFGQKLDGLG